MALIGLKMAFGQRELALKWHHGDIIARKDFPFLGSVVFVIHCHHASELPEVDFA